MNSIVLWVRWSLSLFLVYVMYAASGWPLGLLTFIVMAQGEVVAVALKFNRIRIEGLETAIITAVESMREHLKRRDAYRRTLH